MGCKRIGRIVSVLMVAVTLAACCFAREDEKPRCTAKLRGQFWPEQANSDPGLVSRLIRTGQLEICTVRVWRHRWEPLTVTVSQLAKESGPKAEGPKPARAD